MKIKELTVKNFMSVGNSTQAVDFEKANLTLVLGENLDQGGDDSGSRNGTGKTTILNALSYALYGNALSNIKKDNLINKINNKNMLVTLTFEKDGNTYRIERGRKPTVLKFFVNEESQILADDAQGDMRETQKDLHHLFGMSHDMFKHIVALNTYTEPFLSMRANDQREIIEQLLGITLLSEKAEALKELIRQTKDTIYQETANIEAAKKSNEKIQQSIDTLLLRQKAWYNQQETDLEKLARAIVEMEGVDIEAEIADHSLLKEYLEQRATMASLNKEKATLESASSQALKTRDKYVREIESLDNKKCHACDQELHDHKHKELLETATQHLLEAQKYCDKVTADYTKICNELSKFVVIDKRPETYYDTLEQALKHQTNFRSLEQQLEIKAVDTDPYQEQIDEMRTAALQEISWDKINEATALKDHQEFLLKLLTNKDSFIRKKIIDQNLAYLNNRLSYYLDNMGLPHNVVFQNDLTVEITQLGQDLDFHNLSRGEMNRVILSLSWAFRDVWESLYQSINLLFVDELVDSGLDANGIESALTVLKGMARERHKNVFLISHKEELVGRVNNILRVVKEGGFTSYDTDLEIR
jgi:DNA repair exonuclease SbcCD ATPase subunit